VSVDIGDPFLYLESDGRRVVVTNALEEFRIAGAAPEPESLTDSFPYDLAPERAANQPTR
jgi:hypothetical protein